MGKGVIYILTNPSFPQYVKIGYATNLEKRLRELNRSEALPYAFRAYATYETDHRLVDKTLHELIDRLNPDLRTIETFDGKKRTKEFFEMSPEEAYSILDAIARISGTEGRLKRVRPTGEQLEDEREAEESRRPRRPPLRFSAIGIEEGDVLSFVDDPSKTVTVADDRHVRYGDVVTSLSALAEELSGSGHAMQGPRYFTFEGETLADRRERMEGPLPLGPCSL